MLHMDQKNIIIFLELVRCRNISNTAKNLYMSQSAVSSRLKALEDELGCQLVLRSKGQRSIELTRQGEAFVSVAERWNMLMDEMKSVKSSALSAIRIASNGSTYDRLLDGFLRQYAEQHPEKRVCVKICDSQDVYDQVSKDLTDFGFASYESQQGGVCSRCIDQQSLCIIRRSENPESPHPISPGELNPEQEVRFIGGDFSGMILWRKKWFGTENRCHVEINTASGVRSFLQHSNYWALIPASSARELAQQIPLQIYTLAEQPEPWRVYLVRNPKSASQNLESCRTFEAELLAYTDNLHNLEKRQAFI